MHEITLVDYGVGNIKAYLHIFDQLNIPANTANSPQQLAAAKRLILPGVGSFDWAMSKLQASGMRSALDKAVLEKKTPVFGVCVGMQMMAERSAEGKEKGLGWISGDVVKLEPTANKKYPLPHMGWNSISQRQPHKLTSGLVNPNFYFLHSYVVQLTIADNELASTHYGREFTSAIAHNNIMATQFHPEKSHRWGLALLKNFASY
jgi:imidazole glycerol-phosphate synthase subunit HisH